MNSIISFSNSSKSHLSSRLQSRMYSAEGAQWQERALARLDRKGSPAHLAIGRLVTAINNGLLTVTAADAQYSALLSR